MFEGRRQQKQEKIEFLGISEPNLNWNVSHLYDTAKRTFQYTYDKGLIYTAASQIHMENLWKPGGIFLGLSRKMISKMLKRINNSCHDGVLHSEKG